MTRRSALAASSAYSRLDESIPIGGLGLPLAEAERRGIADAQYFAAIRAVTVPPSRDAGVDFADTADAGDLCHLGAFFLSGTEGYEQHEVWRSQRVRRLTSFLQLVRGLPIVDLPATGDYVAHKGHVIQLLQRVAEGGVRAADLRPIEKWPQPPSGPLPFAPPRVTGVVTRARVSAFFAAYPRLGRELSAGLPWSGAGPGAWVPAGLANAAARRMLGVRAELRDGSLVSAEEVRNAIGLAGAQVMHRCGGYQTDRLAEFVGELLPVIGAREARRAPGLSGAATSRAVDAVLNSELVWSFRADGQFAWFGDRPGSVRRAT